MGSYKIIACDLDGTLFNDDGLVSDENLSAIKKLAASGVYFVPTTGRTLSEIPDCLRTNPDIRYIIYSNGSGILDKAAHESDLMCIPHDRAKDILETLHSFGAHVAFRQNGQCFADAKQQTDQVYEYNHVWSAHIDTIQKNAVFLEDFLNISCTMENIEVITAFFHDEDELEHCRKCFESTGDLLVVQACPYNLEIFSIKAGKGNSLNRLASMAGVSTEDIVAVGDSGNDIAMASNCGRFLAVNNACDALKMHADDIICSNNEHVAEYILTHYILERI